MPIFQISLLEIKMQELFSWFFFCFKTCFNALVVLTNISNTTL